ncbi:hypothetical protein R1sor_027222 [Riccia sorocarpa]|uniref:Uncharacterized protein n=1 Tax=Riccia sorocarpa TaxID=122646 RepID=A0ABD3GHU2_9MARC
MDVPTEDIREGELESEEDRVRRMLEELFGVEEENRDFGEDEDWEGEVLLATDIHPEELYYHLESEGLLRPPVTIDFFIQSEDEESRASGSRFWGEWKTHEIQLQRDVDCTNRLKYNTVVTPLPNDTCFPEIFVSRVWDGEQVPAFIGFGSLLEGKDGVYRAGLEVGHWGFKTRESSSLPVSERPGTVALGATLVTEVCTEMKEVRSEIRDLKLAVQKLQNTVEIQSGDTSKILQAVESLPAIPDFAHILDNLEVKTRSYAAVVKDQTLALLENEREKSEVHLKSLQEAVKEQKVLLKEESPQLQHALTAMEGRIELTVSKVMTQKVTGSVAPDHNFAQVLSDMEDRLRTYVDTARVSQASVLHEQELERAAQKARSLNLRVVGLAETEG